MKWKTTEQKPKAEQVVVGIWYGENIDHTDLCYYADGQWYSVTPGISEPIKAPDYWIKQPEDEE